MEHSPDKNVDLCNLDGQPAEPECQVRERLEVILGRLGDLAGELWLFCMYCERYFQAKKVRPDFLGNREGCAFCDAAGFDVALFAWDVWHEAGDPVFPDPRFD